MSESDENDPELFVPLILGETPSLDDNDIQTNIHTEYHKILAVMEELYGGSGFNEKLHGDVILSLATARVQHAWISRTMFEMETGAFGNVNRITATDARTTLIQKSISHTLKILGYMRLRLRDLDETKHKLTKDLQISIANLKPKETNTPIGLPIQELALREKIKAPAPTKK